MGLACFRKFSRVSCPAAVMVMAFDGLTVCHRHRKASKVTCCRACAPAYKPAVTPLDGWSGAAVWRVWADNTRQVGTVSLGGDFHRDGLQLGFLSDTGAYYTLW